VTPALNLLHGVFGRLGRSREVNILVKPQHITQTACDDPNVVHTRRRFTQRRARVAAIGKCRDHSAVCCHMVVAFLFEQCGPALQTNGVEVSVPCARERGKRTVPDAARQRVKSTDPKSGAA